MVAFATSLKAIGESGEAASASEKAANHEGGREEAKGNRRKAWENRRDARVPRITVTGASLSPSEVPVGEPSKAIVSVMNAGGKKRTKTIKIKVAGKTVASEDVTDLE